MALRDRLRKLLRRKPKRHEQQQQRPERSPNHRPLSGHQHHQGPTHNDQAPIGGTDGTADDSFRTEAATPATRSGQLQIAFQNTTTSNQVYAYVTGSAIDRNNSLFLLSADARTPYYPPNPNSTGTRLARDVSIRLGAPGTTVNAVIPRLAGGRIWFSVGRELVFALNPGPNGGPGLIEPSVSGKDLGGGEGVRCCVFADAVMDRSSTRAIRISIRILVRKGGRKKLAGSCEHGASLSWQTPSRSGSRRFC